MTVWHVCISCWILKALHTHTHTHRLCNAYCFSTAPLFTRMGFSVTLYAHCLSCCLCHWIIQIVEIHCKISAEREERRAKKRRSRWGGDEKEKTFIPGMPTVLPTNLSKQQEEAYLGKAALFGLLINLLHTCFQTGAGHCEFYVCLWYNTEFMVFVSVIHV